MDLSIPTRQSIKGLVFIFLQSVRQAARALWPIIPLMIVQKNTFTNNAIIPIVLVAILLLLLVHTVLYYLHFYFYVKDDEFVLKKGYLRKKVLTIPIERIQSVNTKQNLIQQLLDVVALELDTAGAIGKELKIHALDRDFAKGLYQLLSNKKENVVTVNEETEAIETEKLVLKIEPIDLLKIGISQNHLRTGLIVIAFGSQIINQLRDMFKEQTDEYSNAFVKYMSGSSFTIIAFLLVFFLLVSILISLVRTLVKYYDFKLIKAGKAYRIEAGILNKRNVVVPHQKIQQLNWENGPIKKLFGMYTLVFKQAVSGQNKKVQLVDAPGCLTSHLALLKSDLFGVDQFSDSTKIRTDKYYFRRLWLFTGWLPMFFATLFLYSVWIFWIIAVVWLLTTAVYSFLMVQKSYFKISNSQVQVSSGAIAHKWKQMELFKIQSVEFKQTIFQKRRQLASLKLMNASGSIRIPYIKQEIARQLYDYLLYHAETSKKSWM